MEVVNKTLIGKNGYLFLQNDSCKELNIHNENLCLVNQDNLNVYNSIRHKFFMVVFPDKSFACKDHLPDGYNMTFRPGFDIYKQKLGLYILDGVDALTNHGDVFYKTDTHMNLKGAYIIYLNFLHKINRLFRLNLEFTRANLFYKTVDSLAELGNGLGDLTWSQNLGDQTLASQKDVFIFSDDITMLYTNYNFIENDPIRICRFENNIISDVTDAHIGESLDWNIISKYILYKKNDTKPKRKILIFYDSFLLSTLSLYLELTDEVYMAKSILNKDLIDCLKPDFIFEFRVERFLL